MYMRMHVFMCMSAARARQQLRHAHHQPALLTPPLPRECAHGLSQVRTGRRVSIIGSGPAGLAAADELNKMGHEVG
jgi:NADPH-dependent 2,4-dienoyl-CoA reductase/sulfur reductase-like enzyme